MKAINDRTLSSTGYDVINASQLNHQGAVTSDEFSIVIKEEFVPTESEAVVQSSQLNYLADKMMVDDLSARDFISNSEVPEPSTSKRNKVGVGHHMKTGKKQDKLQRGHFQDDESIQELLLKWGLRHMIPLFEAEHVNTTVLRLMDQDDFDEFTSKLKFGEKVLFKHHFHEWRSTGNLPVAVQKIANNRQYFPASPLSSSSSFGDDDGENKKSKKITVLEIIQRHQSGRFILDKYKETNELTPEQRNLLISIIVQYYESKGIHMRTQTSYKIEKQILKIFPTEKIEYYRTSRRGKIYIKYVNNKSKKALRTLRTASK